MKLKALRAQRYGTRRLMAGDEFEASRADARVLTALKRAEAAQAKAAPAKQSKPEPEPEPNPETEAEEVTATDLRRMRKAELASYLQDAGQQVDDGMTREDMLDRALAMQSED